MTDEEMVAYIGLVGNPMGLTVVKDLSPAKRATYERMAILEMELALWQDGLGQKPLGVLIDAEQSVRDRKAWL